MTPELEQALRTVVARAPEMTQEQREGWLKVIRMLKEMYRKHEAQSGWMPQSAVDAMRAAVPDQLMADVVREQRHGPGQPGSWAKEPDAPKQPVVRGSGWSKPLSESTNPRQTEMFDNLVAHMVGGPNSPVK